MSSSSFDPNKEIAELKTKLAELESDLKKPNVSEAREIAIRKNIDTVGNQIAPLYSKLPQQEQPRSLKKILWDSLPTAVLMLSCSYIALRYYSIFRHHITPYTPEQFAWRRWAFFLDSPEVPNAKRIAAGSALVAVYNDWRNPANSPPPNWTREKGQTGVEKKGES